MKKVRRHDEDTGSAEVQIALISRRIEDLSSHLKKNRKDTHSRRGLLQLVADRQSKMRYLKSKSTDTYNKVCDELGLKKK